MKSSSDFPEVNALIGNDYFGNQGLNLKCVKLDISETQTKITMNPKIKHTKSALIFTKSFPKNLQANVEKDSKKALQTYFFSIYLGQFAVEETVFLVFANRVLPIKFGNVEIFKILQMCVYALHSALPDIELSLIMTDLLRERTYFSYKLDLTKRIAENCSKPENGLNPFLASLVNLMDNDSTSSDLTWFTPVVIGNIMKMRVNEMDMFLIYRESCFSISPICKGDLNLLSNFYSPTNLSSYEFVFFKEKELKVSLGFILSSYPGIITFVNDQNEKFEGSNFNSEKIYKFIQFFNEFFECEHFLSSGSSKIRSVFRKIAKYVSENAENDVNTCRIQKFVSIPEKVPDNNILTNSNAFCSRFGKLKTDKNSCKFFEFNFALIVENKQVQIEQILIGIFESLLKNPLFLEIFPDQNFSEFIRKKENKIFISDFEIINSKIALIFEKSKNISLRKHIILHRFYSFETIYPKIFGERNFLFNFLKKIIRNCDESIFEKQEISVCVLTHNCSGVIPNSSNELGYIKNPKINSSEVLIIGLQEILEMKSKNLKSIMTNENNKQTKDWENFFKSELKEFVLIGSKNMLGLMILVLVKKSVSDKFEITLEKATRNRLGFMNILANKGFVSLTLKINYDRISLINCHFESGNSKDDFYKRVEQLRMVLGHFQQNLLSPMSFVFGDMNFRCDISGGDLDNIFIDIEKPVNETIMIARMSPFDQLRNYMNHEELGKIGVYEGEIGFLPSYKMVPNSGTYNSQQVPGWCIKKD